MQRFLRRKIIEIVRINEKLCYQARILNKYLDLLRAIFERNLPRRVKIDPLEIIQVDPNEVRLKSNNEFQRLDFLLLSPVLDGEWDKDVIPLDQYDLHSSLLNHFDEGKNWEETEFYNRVRNQFEEDKNLSKWGCSSFQQFKNRLDLLDELYDRIETEGYKTQSQLRKEGQNLFDINYAIMPERHEITVNIGRKGEMILADGRHRLTIAKSIGISAVPVRVKVRHKEWQIKRIKAKRGLLKDSKYINHPDIQNIK